MLDKKDLYKTMADMGVRARIAAGILATTDGERKTAALIAMAQAITDNCKEILDANVIDMEMGRKKNLSTSFMDRLELNAERIASMANGLKDIAALAEPVGRVLAEWDRPNGLRIQRVSTPLGVIGVIYESRPNVTADAGALCLKAGNAVILRGGTDAINSSKAIHDCLVKGLEQAGLPGDAIQMVQTTDRDAVGEMLKGLDSNIDVIVPRGGKGLVARVQEDARVPVFAHLEGLCHVYVDASANVKMATEIAVNSKMRRTGICGSAETLLIDKNAVDTHLKPVLEALADAGCALRGDKQATELFGQMEAAKSEDWTTEYLDAVLSVAIVDGIDGAIEHINRYSSNHTDAIVAEDREVVSKFFTEIDSAILLHNASTQFADGGEFGMGAEIGIATGKMHARGPVGVEQLTSFKYLVRGSGQVRPS